MPWLMRERRGTAAAQVASIHWLAGRSVPYDVEDVLQCERQQQRQDLAEVLEHTRPAACNRWVTACASGARADVRLVQRCACGVVGQGTTAVW